MMKRRILQWFTASFLVVCIWTAYANVLSDDAEVRKLARVTVNQAAGCGDDCKLESMRGERSMIEERVEYDVLKHGHYVVACRRAMIIAGAYACDVKEGTVAASASSSAPASSGSAKKP